MSNNNELTADDIKNLANFLFWKTNEGENSQEDIAQVGFFVWVFKKTALGEGKKGTYFTPQFVTFNTPIPFLTKSLAETIDLEVHLFCNGIQIIKIQDLPLGEKPLLMGQIIEIAIKKAKGDIKEDIGGLTGFVKRKFSKEPEESIYKVEQTGSYYEVYKGIKKNNTMSWALRDNTSPRTKAIINQFKKEFAKGTLQTEFENNF